MKKNILQVLLIQVLLCLSAVFQADASTTVPSLITSNQVWTASGSPYMVNQNTYISSGVTVTVMPGVEITGTGIFTINIDGEFQALGKWDSTIKITKTELSFSKISLDYSNSTGKGAYFLYCEIYGNGAGSSTISGISTSMKIDHCNFYKTYQALYLGGSDSVLIEVSNSKFIGDPKIGGSPIYCFNMASKTKVLYCEFYDQDNLHLYGSLIFNNNTLNRVRVTYLFLTGYSEFICNKITNMAGGMSIYMYGNTIKDQLKFNNNTLDSVGSNFSSYMFYLSKNGSNSKLGKIEINNNNFLLFQGSGSKIKIGGTNQLFTQTDTVNFKDNYWGSNDSTTIETYIKDYYDDINIYGRVNFDGFLSSPIVGCSYNTECATAYFNYTINDSIVTFSDQSAGSKPHKVKWNFGDSTGNDSNVNNIVHSYNTPGIYKVTMYVYDTADNFCDSTEHIIEILSKSKCQASFYFAEDTSNNQIIYIINTSTGVNMNTNFYWTFGDGTGSSATNPTHSYSNTGPYNLCLTIFDTAAGCYSTFCDSVNITSNNMMLYVLNENDLSLKDQSNIFNTVTVYPNPSAGQVKLSLTTNTYSTFRIDILNANGQIVSSEYYQSEIGNNEMDLDLRTFENGLYCINIHSENFTKTIKIVLNK